MASQGGVTGVTWKMYAAGIEPRSTLLTRIGGKQMLAAVSCWVKFDDSKLLGRERACQSSHERKRIVPIGWATL